MIKEFLAQGARDYFTYNTMYFYGFYVSVLVGNAVFYCCIVSREANCSFSDFVLSLLNIFLQHNCRLIHNYIAKHIVKPAFVDTLFPVTRPHHIYSTAMVIIIVIDNLKYVIIFI